jgi:hypothetical protein
MQPLPSLIHTYCSGMAGFAGIPLAGKIIPGSAAAESISICDVDYYEV